MTSLRRSALVGLFSLILAMGVCWILPTDYASAQIDTAGLKAVGAVTRLSADDPRVIAARVINVALGLLAIIMVSIILYAGFLWMTSGGENEKVEKAQKYIKNAVIGLIIILSSWAIATYVINKLLDATQGSGGGISSSGPGGGFVGGGTGGATAFQVRSITPSGSLPIRNVEVRVLFSRDVDPATASANIQVLQGTTPVDGRLTIDGGLVTFTPTSPCPAPYADRRCFASDTNYTVRVNTGLRSATAQAIVCGGFAASCTGAFRTGNLVDVTGPTASISAPFNGQSIPVEDLVPIMTRGTDDTGVSLIETYRGTIRIGRDAPAPTSTPLRAFDGTVYWDTRGVATGTTHNLFSRVHDIDSNVATSSPVTVIARAAHCFNGRRDSDETGIDCGGSECGVCSGGACRSDLECSGGVCRVGICVEQPIITNVSPADGRVGTFVTITGVSFGFSPGRVFFGGIPARAPAVCTTAGSRTWSPIQVVVEVPVGATSSAIRIENASTSLVDATNDDRGPRLENFIVNSVSRPGICAAVPDHGQVGSTINFPGSGLGSVASQVYFGDRQVTSLLAPWTDTNFRVSTPVWQPALYAVRVSSTGLYSNAVNYRIDERENVGPPVIDSITPNNGPIGEYITIHGSNFGDRPDIVRIRSAAGEGVADFTFPAACGTGYWRHNAIVFKVPPTIRPPGGLGTIPVGTGSYQVSVRRLADRAESAPIAFTVNTNPPRPGLCSIQPAAGPVNTAVNLYGDRLGTSGVLQFPGTGGTQVTATIDPGGWTNNEIRARVPSGAISGFVAAQIRTQQSNSLSFQVKSCREDASICRGAQICCASGACSNDAGVCPAVAVNTHYAWRTSTGIIPLNPQVVEECDMTSPPSPSPWATRTGGNRACLNSDVIARFNTRLNPSTVTAPGNFVVRKCTATTGDPCSTTTVVPPRTGYPTIRPVAPGSPTQYVRFRPATTWDASSTYMVVLTTGITSAVDLGSLPMLENRSRCGAGNAYCFRFATRASMDACEIGSVTVAPNPYTASDLGELVDYEASPRPADDICVELDGSMMPWLWSTSDGRASITHRLNASGTAEGNEQIATALAETGRTPVGIRADLINPGAAPVRGTTPLFINLVPPRVEASGPNCDSACTNALLWVRFNVGMDLPSFTTLSGSNVILKRCTNESCRIFDATYELDDLALTTVPGAPSGAPLRYLTAQTMRTAGGIRTSYLEEGKFYKAILRSNLVGGIRSSALLPLTGLNDPEGYAWTFRVKTGENARCSVNSVSVMPAEKFENVIGGRQMFVAQPMGSPDACNEEGQPLNSDSTYAWSSTVRTVAEFFLGGRLDTTSRLAPRCNGRCLNMGSDGAVGKVASCGNSVVETTNSAYCRAATPCTENSDSHPACVRADNGLPCRLGDTGCIERRTRFNDWCVVLAPDAVGGEECDLGPGRNTPTALCGLSCLWNPQLPITPTSTGRTCGNATVERGEQCDPGRSCVAGSNLGIVCTTDVQCGTGGRCAVAERNGCSDSCQALGSDAAGSTCGNGDVADGETCDIRGLASNHGCSADCRHEGSRPVTSLCGNGRIEPGESCERTGGTWPAPGCNATTCLKMGTDTCRARTALGCCGNATIDAGEDCDGGEGCSNRCLLAGSSSAYETPSFCGNGAPLETGEQCEATSPGDRLVDNRQLAYIVGAGTPDPTTGRMQSTIQADYERKIGEATYGLQCGYTLESSCPSGTGLTDAGCCAQRPVLSASYPPDRAEDVCRNVLISGIFPMQMAADSLNANFIVAELATSTTCGAGTRALETVPVASAADQGWFRSLWSRIIGFFTTPAAQADGHLWCVGGVVGQVAAYPEGRGTKVTFSLRNALKANTRYKVVFRGDPALRDAILRGTRLDRRVGIKTNLGTLALPDPVTAPSGALTWTFRTGRRICAVNQVAIRDTNAEHPFLFTRSNEVHQYEGTVNAIHNGAVVPLSSIVEYSWRWEPWVSSEPTILTIPAPARVATDLSISHATPTAQSRNGTSLIAGRISITRDDVQIPSTRGRIMDASRNSTVILCERPWPSLSLAPFADRQGSPSLAASSTLFASGPFYNFSTLYCRDAGNPGPEDDLPNLTINPVPLNATDRNRGILRQYLFTYLEDALKQDGIGIRVVSNPLHLSPSAWYRAQGFSGTPESLTVDGYEAIRDGSTVYVASVNVDDASSGPVTSTIYVISRNPDALPETINIYNQLLSNWSFNINLRGSPNVCVNSGEEYHLRNDAPVRCTADWECLQVAPGLHCASFKAKMQRDTKRIADFQAMTELLEQRRVSQGSYPVLNSGTYVQTMVTSRWASWQSVLGVELGSRTLPIDPINRFLTCGRCRSNTGLGNACIDSSDCQSGATCVAEVDPTDPLRNGYDPATCWNELSRRFQCPVMDPRDRNSTSRVYQYRAVDGGSRYEVSTELEGPTDRYQPPLTTEVSKCSNTRQVCRTNNDCIVRGDAGAVLSSGTCNPTGGRWNYSGLCTGAAYGTDDVCGNGVIGRPRETCEIGNTLPVSCTTGDGRRGTKLQICSDCTRWVDGPSTVCVADSMCGNGRIDNYRCYGGSGFRYGQACTTPTSGASTECADPRDPPGTVMSCQSVGSGQQEVCDDGAQNGTYGHCNTTCSALTGSCGDGMISGGELCDNGAVSSLPGHPANGEYCGLPSRTSCRLEDSCSYDCRERAPHCGDEVVQAPEQCDGGSEVTASALCRGGDNAGRPCTGPTDCSGGTCGGDAIHNACTGTVGRCAGVGNVCESGTTHPACVVDGDCTGASAGRCVPRTQLTCTPAATPAGAAAADAACGTGGRCVTYATQHSRACGAVGTPTQCTWDNWSVCLPVGRCGDGRVDEGEQCDDGNTNNNDGCTNVCRDNVCGDGMARAGVEECDYGSRNGTTVEADYGATVMSCSLSCRQIPSSGGYCGDRVRNGSEQCDGDESVPSGLTCGSLGYDYAARIKCAHRAFHYHAEDNRIISPSLGPCCLPDGRVGLADRGTCVPRPGGDVGNFSLMGTDCRYSAATTSLELIAQAHRSECTGPITEILSCSNQCGFSGCLRCQDDPGTGSIEGTVYDAIYSNQPVPNARVTLSQSGRRVTEVFTDANGRFSFTAMNTRPECSTYRIVVDSYVDNPCTGGASGRPNCALQPWPPGLAAEDEGRNGGYWPYESETFNVSNFTSVGLRNASGKIYLAPKVAQGETLVVLTWDGTLPSGRFLDSHLLLPIAASYVPAGTGYAAAAPTNPARRQDVYYGSPGLRDLRQVPYARLFCYHADGSENCGSFDTAPETIRYRRTVTTGEYAYYVVDYSPRTPASYQYYNNSQAVVRVITHDNPPYVIRPPTTAPACTGASPASQGKYWLVFKQDALSGSITVPGSGTGELQCHNSPMNIDVGIPSPRIPGPLQAVGSP